MNWHPGPELLGGQDIGLLGSARRPPAVEEFTQTENSMSSGRKPRWSVGPAYS
jgi:hypothetical protein